MKKQQQQQQQRKGQLSSDHKSQIFCMHLRSDDGIVHTQILTIL